MFDKNSDPADPRVLRFDSDLESRRLASDFRARAERYRRLAETLFDENVVAVVLSCARELEEHAEAISEGQPHPQRPD